GDAVSAATLLGPESREYIESLGADVEGMLLEAQEGIGTWPDATDRSSEELFIGEFDFGQLYLVLLRGTVEVEGEVEERTEAFPVVDDGSGYLVEWMGFDPELGGRAEFASPGEADGLADVPSDGLIEVFFPLDGIVTFVLDGEIVRTIGTQPVGANGEPYAKYEPTDGFEIGEHDLVVLFASDRAVFASSVELTVVEP
ncbi:MAG: hypothetical protein H0W25_08130, partial [Acidimicrobiia bacterium]|nr:hypothetical protein [Acidimicrobiia bacterium]